MRRSICGLASACAIVACGGGPISHGVTIGGPTAAPTGDRQVTLILFSDAALVHERWRVPLHDGRGQVDVPLDAAIDVDDLAVLGTEGARLVGLALRRPSPDPGDRVTVEGSTGTLVLSAGNDVAILGADHALHVLDSRGLVEYEGGDVGGVHAAITLEGTGAEGWVELTYSTPRISWSAAYALIRDRTGAHATLDGAVAIDNKSGVAFPGAAVTVVDRAAAASRTRAASDLAKALLGTSKKDDPAASRELGIVDVDRGQTRLALAAAPHALPLREILVFDPVGTKFDAPGSIPQKARNHGLDAKPATTVLRSFEIDLDPATRGSLPAGPVRLFGRGDHGELAPLGAGRLFDRAQGEAKTATVPVGRSPDVKATRRRTDFFIDETGVLDAKGVRSRRMIIEEFTITLTNSGKAPVQVLVREHMYRGETWGLAYASPQASRVTKEGPQQIAMRVDVPGAGETRVVYRVVYTW